jgi:hypothetical protein
LGDENAQKGYVSPDNIENYLVARDEFGSGPKLNAIQLKTAATMIADIIESIDINPEEKGALIQTIEGYVPQVGGSRRRRRRNRKTRKNK